LGGLENVNQFREAPLVGVACGAVTVGFDPVRMLDAQVLVNLLLKLAVRMNLLRHDNFLSEGSNRIGFRFRDYDFVLQGGSRHDSSGGFSSTHAEMPMLM
jgi:hypothetical protein